MEVETSNETQEIRERMNSKSNLKDKQGTWG
jgi:hypothetical protein